MTRPLKILVINWQDITNPLAGGAEVHLHEVFERIARRGHHVTLFCHRFDGSPEVEYRNGIHIIRIGGRFLFNYLVPYVYYKRFRHDHFDVVVDDVNKIPFFTPLFVKEPVQGVTHHLFGKSIFLETVFPLAAYVYLAERLIRSVYRRVHFIIGSPSTHKEYMEWGFPAEQVSIVNYCVNHDTYRHDPSVAPHPDLIGYFGRLKKYKSVDHLLQALSMLAPDFPHLRVDIIGDGDDRPRLETLTHELGLDDRVCFRGFVPEAEKSRLLQNFYLAVNTSSKEGWGLTVVEANACGVPVIAADVQGLRDSVVNGKTGILYPFGDVPALAQAIRELLQQPERREELKQEALKWAASFDWEKAVDATLDHLEQTIAGSYRHRPSETLS